VQAKKEATYLAHYGVRNPNQSRLVREKTEATCQARYGAKSNLANKESREKAQRTMQDRYGVKYSQQSTVIQAATQQTNLSRYGTSNVLQAAALQEKIQATLKQRYGATNPSQSPVIQKRKEATRKVTLELARIKRLGREVWEKIKDGSFWKEEYQEKKKPLIQIAKELNLDANTCCELFHQFSDLPLRTPLYGGFISSQEIAIMQFLKSTGYQGPIEQQQSMSQIAYAKGQTLTKGGRLTCDLYLPDSSLIIEFNGLYWHSDQMHPDPNYHLYKTETAQSLGIRLIHIWSDDWETKQDLVKSKLKHILGLNGDLPRVHSRQCTVREIKDITAVWRFYQHNHIKGPGPTGTTLALCTPEDQVVALATFVNKGAGLWDWDRFAVDITKRVPGAAAKLLAHFKRTFAWTKIYTYADRAWSSGNVYSQLGFTLAATTPVAFHGIENNRRRSRWNYTLPKLKNRFPDLWQEGMTQKMLLELADIPLVYDCGNLRFEMQST
jgi:hypothetical protein